MSGNVWEWTRSLYLPYPYTLKGGREDIEEMSQGLRVLRGGSYLDFSWFVRCACRSWLDPGTRLSGVGFRVVLSPFSSDL